MRQKSGKKTACIALLQRCFFLVITLLSFND